MSSFILLSPLSKPNAFDEYVKFKVRNNNGKEGSQTGLFSNQNKPQTSETLIVTDIQQIFGHLSNKGSGWIVQTWTNNRQIDGLMQIRYTINAGAQTSF